MLGRIEERHRLEIWWCDRLGDVSQRAQLAPELGHAADRLPGAMQFDEAARRVAPAQEGGDVRWRLRRPGLPSFEKVPRACLRQAPCDTEHDDLRYPVNLEAEA